MMISHKEEAVSKSESLIGVTQQEYFRMPTDDHDMQKSKYVSAVTFSLDLKKY